MMTKLYLYHMESKALKNIILLLVVFVSQNAISKTLVVTPKTKISQVSVYSELGNGDVFITVDNSIVGCDSGFWVSGDSAGSNKVLSTILAAKHSQSIVQVYGDKDRIWSGSTGKFCHIYVISEF